MITTTQTSRGLLSGRKTFMWAVNHQYSQFLLRSKRLVSYLFRNFVVVVIFSLGVALSRGHGKFFFRGNVTVEEGRKSSHLLFCVTHIYSTVICLIVSSVLLCLSIILSPSVSLIVFHRLCIHNVSVTQLALLTSAAVLEEVFSSFTEVKIVIPHCTYNSL